MVDARDLYRDADNMEAQAKDMEVEAGRIKDSAHNVYRDAQRLRGDARELEKVQADAQAAANDAARDASRGGRPTSII
jgi:hypothetical protein